MTVAAAVRDVEITAHAGPQTAFLESPADIVVYGGAASGGKTYALLLECAKWVETHPRFAALVFRRELTRITSPGGMWDESLELYQGLGAQTRLSPRPEHVFPSGARITFGHLEHEQSKHSYAGAQIPLICFDQLEEFTEGQFWFLLSRNRSTCGVTPYIRATANPVPPEDPVGGWLSELLRWWWDQDTGYAIEERSGVVRWFVRVDEKLLWGDTRAEAAEKALALGASDPHPKSFTFVAAKIDDNPTLQAADPGYRGNLEALPLIERERLLHGNWKIQPAAGKVLNRAWFEMVDAVPAEAHRVRGWDKAATPGSGDWSAGAKLSRVGGTYYVEDVVRGQWSGAQRRQVQKQVAAADGPFVEVWLEQEPGSSGKEVVQQEIQELAGCIVHAERPTGDKLTRSMAFAAQAEVGNVKLLRGDWNEAFLHEAHNFTGEDGGVDDQVDAVSLAFNKLALGGLPRIF